MTGPRDDRDLRLLFEEARAKETAEAPPFELAWRAAARVAEGRRPRRAFQAMRGLAAAAGLAALLAAVAILRLPRSGEPTADAAIARARAIAAWTAPTDAFLEISDLAIPDSVPSLDTSSVALPGVTATPTVSGVSDPRAASQETPR